MTATTNAGIIFNMLATPLILHSFGMVQGHNVIHYAQLIDRQENIKHSNASVFFNHILFCV